jgi:hypothetical protein
MLTSMLVSLVVRDRVAVLDIVTILAAICPFSTLIYPVGAKKCEVGTFTCGCYAPSRKGARHSIHENAAFVWGSDGDA